MAPEETISERTPLLGAEQDDQSRTGEPDSFPHDDHGNGAVEPSPKPADAEGQEEEDEGYQGMPEVRKQMKYILPAIAIGVFLCSADQTIIVASYGKIGSDLKALRQTSWIATAYFLTLTSIQPLYGKLSDIFGRKQCLLFAYATFGIGCLWCGVARSMNELIIARAFSGIGGGGMTTVTSILLSDIMPIRIRGTWQGYINIIWAMGAGSGAPLGGLLADAVGWRWAFIGQAPLCIVAIVAVHFALKLPPPASEEHWRAKLRRVDFLGALILVSAVYLLILGLHTGSNESWSSVVTIISLSVSLPLFALFLLVEIKFASEPFAPGNIIFERSMFACYMCNFFSFGGWMACIFYIPLFFQAVEGRTASQAGLQLLPAVIAGVSGSLLAGKVMQSTGRYYWGTVIAYGALTFGMLPIIFFTGLISISPLGIAIGLIACGAGSGFGVTTSLIALIRNAGTKDQAVATACSYLFRSLGSVVGLSLSATVVNQFLRTHLRQSLPSGREADEIVERVRDSLDYIKTLEPGVKAIVQDCYGRATRAGFVMNMIFLSGSLVAAVFIREKTLGR